MRPRTLLAGLASALMAVARPPLAAVAALLPVRYWQTFSSLPIRAMGLPSALATILAGLFVGGRGFMAYAVRAADAASQATLDAAARQASGSPPGGPPIDTLAPQLVSIASVAAFTLLTPLGWLATYCTLSGLLRVASVVADHGVGDPILTALDGTLRAAWARARHRAARARRARAEGAETADCLFTGEGAGLPGVDYALVASRRKDGWTAGTIVVTSDGWFRLGRPFDASFPYGLRTVYPLTRLDTCEVLRRAIRCELPPLRRGPGRLERR